MLYITTSGDLSTLRLTTPSATISLSVSVCLTLILALTLLWVLLPFLLYFDISHHAPFVHSCSGFVHVQCGVCVCGEGGSSSHNATFSPFSTYHICFSC